MQKSNQTQSTKTHTHTNTHTHTHTHTHVRTYVRTYYPWSLFLFNTHVLSMKPVSVQYVRNMSMNNVNFLSLVTESAREAVSQFERARCTRTVRSGCDRCRGQSTHNEDGQLVLSVRGSSAELCFFQRSSGRYETVFLLPSDNMQVSVRAGRKGGKWWDGAAFECMLHLAVHFAGQHYCDRWYNLRF